MRLSRRVLALMPLLLTPLVLVGIDSMSSDKAIILAIPWLAFSIVHLLLFFFLNRHIGSIALLILTSGLVSLLSAYAITYAIFSYAWRAGP